MTISTPRRRPVGVVASFAAACLLVVTIQTTPSQAAPLFSDGFETGNLSAWSVSTNFVAQSTSVHSGSWAGRARSSGAASHVGRTFGAQSEVWSTVWFKVAARASAVWLTSLRKASGGAILLVGINKNGLLIARNNATQTTYQSTVVVSGGNWHRVDVHLKVGTGGRFDVSLDAAPVAALSRSNALGTATIAQMKIGDTYTGRSFDVAFDDVSVASDAGPSDTSDPTQPEGLVASLESELSVRLDWQPSDDDTGVTGYTIRRSTDGASYSLAGSSATTSFIDTGLAGHDLLVDRRGRRCFREPIGPQCSGDRNDRFGRSGAGGRQVGPALRRGRGRCARSGAVHRQGAPVLRDRRVRRHRGEVVEPGDRQRR